MTSAPKWIKVEEDVRTRHTLYAVGPRLVGLMVCLGLSMVASGVAMMQAAGLSSHMAAIRIALDAYICLQLTQIVVAAVVIRNVLTAHPVRLMILTGLGATTILALLAALFMATALNETSLVEDLLDRIGSEPFFTLDLLVDPLHPIVDLLASYYLRSIETETITRELSNIVTLTAAILLIRDLPLCLYATLSRRLRVRCEGEVHRTDDALKPWKRAMRRMIMILAMDLQQPQPLRPKLGWPKIRMPRLAFKKAAPPKTITIIPPKGRPLLTSRVSKK